MKETPRDARGLLDAVRASQPGAYALATAVSIAARVEPALVRRARVELFPRLSAGDEADLWFGPLVQARSPLAIVFAPETADLLRLELSKDQTLLRRARGVVKVVHANSSPVINLVEEEVTYLALSDEPDAEEKIRALLLSAARSMVEGDGRGLAQWALRALPRLPAGARDSEAAWALAVGAGARLGGRRILEGDAPGHVPQSMLRWVLPREHKPAKVGVRLVEEGVELGEPPAEGAHVITLPKTDPLLLEVFWGGGGESESKQVALRPGETQVVETGSLEEVSIRTPTGDTFTVRREYEFDVFVNATPLGERLAPRLREEHWQGRPLRVAAAESFYVYPDLAFVSEESKQSFNDSLQAATDKSSSLPRASRKVVEEVSDYELEVLAARGSGSSVGEENDPRLIRVYTGRRDLRPQLRKHVHVDFSDESRFEENYRRLLALIKDEPYVEPPKRTEPAKIYLAYSHRDERLKERLVRSLTPLVREGLVEMWHDRDVEVGADLTQEINDQLNSADIILMLVSANFLNSKFVYEVEMKRALERHAARGAHVIPVILEPCDWTRTPLGGFQALPSDGRPLASRDDMEEALRGVAEGIRTAAEEVARAKEARKEREAPPQRSLVYISHSTIDSASAELLDALNKALYAADFEFFADRGRIRPGEDWREGLSAMMESADAAVVLLSRRALVSNEVGKEVSFLTRRLKSDKDFLLVPVLLEGVAPYDVDRSYPALRSIHFQIAEGPPDETARRVVEALARLRERGRREPSYTRMLEERIAARLQSVSEHILRPLISEDPEGVSAAPGPGAEVLARLIVRGGMGRLPKKLVELEPYLDEAASREIVELVAPMWVNPEAAAAVRRVALGPQGARALCVNCTQQFTAKMYINRASEKWPPWRVVQLSGGWREGPGESVMVELKQELRANLHLDARWPDSGLGEQLAAMEKSGAPLFVIFPPPLPPPELVEIVKRAFPTLTLFLMAGERMPRPDQFPQGYAEMIHPALDPGEEEETYEAYTYLRSLTERSRAE